MKTPISTRLLKAGLALCVLSGFSLSAETIVNFTPEEGYKDGNLVAHKDWAGLAGYTVRGGVVILDDGLAWKNVTLKKGMLAGQSIYRVGVVLRFEETVALEPERGKDPTLVGIAFRDQPTGKSKQIILNLVRLKNSPDKYALMAFNNSGESEFKKGEPSSRIDLGIGDGGAMSDPLYLELIVSRGADASSWSLLGGLDNLKTGERLLDVELDEFDTSAEFYAGTLYGGPSAGVSSSESGVGNRSIALLRYKVSE